MSFDAFFRAEHQRLAALATALCGDRETGRDVAQEALTRAYQEWDRVGRLERPGGWTRRVVVNLVHDHGRHLGVRRRRLSELASRIAGDAAADEMSLDGEMWAAVASLPERQRTAVALFYIGDRSISDVAEEMGVHEGTVKTTLHKARKRLRRVLSEEAT
ncbi:MAG: SigE family RNA polymerase sigma factor [Ilumatobacteraceae bacterium]|nr:SigE family RNA polymerase sigma factor [Ilumatobacteraceae bacterium]